MRFCLAFLLGAIVVIVPGSVASAGAALVEGPGGSLTLVEAAQGPQTRGAIVYASSGSLTGGFSSAVPISEPGDSAEDVQVATDGAGDVLAVWNADRDYEGFNRYMMPMVLPRGLWFAWRRKGGTFSAPQQLVAPPANEGEVQVAMDPGGEAAIGYEERGSVYIRRASAVGEVFGPPVRAMSGSLSREESTAHLDYVGLDSLGELFVLISRHGILQVRTALPHRALGAAQALTPSSARSEYPTAAVGSGGAALVSWLENGPTGSQVQAIYRPAGTRFGAVQHLTPVQRPAYGTIPEAAVVDGQGDVVLTLIATAGKTPALEVSETTASGLLSAPTAVAEPVDGVAGFSLADNEADETALAYDESSSPGQSIAGTPFTADVRFSTGARPFGAALVTESGAIPLGGPRPIVLVGAGDAFYGVSVSERSPAVHEISRIVSVQRFTQHGAGPQLLMTLPTVTYPLDSPGPTSLVELGRASRVSPRGRIHGRVTCGNHPGVSCSIQITIRSTAQPDTVLARELVNVPASEKSHPLTVALNRTARRLLGERRAITASIATSTSSVGSAKTQTDYPLTLISSRHAGAG
jgi:hypothetical protein